MPGDRRIGQTIPLRFPGTTAAEIDPRFVFVRLDGATAYIRVPLRNVGQGLAVIDEAASPSKANCPAGSKPSQPRVECVFLW